MNTNSRPIDTMIVSKAAQTSLKTTGNLITGATVNLNDGQIGFLAQGLNGSVALNAFLDATPTIAENPIARIVQGTPYSASVLTSSVAYPLAVRSYEQSEPIDFRGPVTVTKQVYRAPSFAITYLSDVEALSNTEYEISLAFRGRRVEENFSIQESAYVRSNYTTPDFSATGLNLTDANAISYLLNNQALDLNKRSAAFGYNSRFGNNAPFVVLGINTAGGSGTAVGGVDPIAAGDSINVVSVNGTTKSFVLTEDMANAIILAATTQTGDVIADVTWTIELIEANDASTNGIDALLIVALDEKLAYDDRVPQVKVDIIVNTPLGYDYANVTNTKLVFADEGQGLARQLEFVYQNSAQAKYALEHDLEPEPKYPSPIVANEKYVLYNIRHDVRVQNGYGSTISYNKLTRVAIPTFSAGTTPNTAVSAFDTAIASYLTSGNNGAVIALN